MYLCSRHKHFNIKQHTKGDMRRGEKNLFLVINGACQFFSELEKKVLKRIKMMEIPGDQNKATTVCTKRTGCAVDY